jgi:hypothetical protein
MENSRRKPLAAIWITTALIAVATAFAAELPTVDDLKVRFFADNPAAAGSTVAPPAAHAAATRKPSIAPQLTPPSESVAGRPAPDWSFTPGRLCTASDPDFKEYRYAEHIPYCNRNVTPQMKQQAAAHYGVPQSDWGNYEFDHLIPLSIGGDSHVDNVWPQPHLPGSPDGSLAKDKLEEQLYLQINAGTITQAAAVQQIYAWFGANHPEMAARVVMATAGR